MKIRMTVEEKYVDDLADLVRLPLISTMKQRMAFAKKLL